MDRRVLDVGPGSRSFPTFVSLGDLLGARIVHSSLEGHRLQGHVASAARLL